MNNNETLMEILAEMRLGSTSGLPCAYRIGRPNRIGEPIRIDSVTVADLADRIEAASLRDRAEAATAAATQAIRLTNEKWRCKAGNMATMHEALETSRDFAKQIEGKTGEADVADDAGEIVETCEEALKAAVRNCDVGTAEEQADRFIEFCYAQRTPDNECRKDCPYNDTSAVCYCQARWAQAPYEKGTQA